MEVTSAPETSLTAYQYTHVISQSPYISVYLSAAIPWPQDKENKHM